MGRRGRCFVILELGEEKRIPFLALARLVLFLQACVFDPRITLEVFHEAAHGVVLPL